MRAIDADELKKCVLKWLPQDPCGKEEKEMPFETDICVSMLMEIDEQPTIQPEIVRCKDCKHFEYDHVESVNGIPLIVAHEICMRWGDGVKTSENGYCFLAERREVTE